MDKADITHPFPEAALWALVCSSGVTCLFVTATVIHDPLAARMWMVTFFESFC